MKGVDMSKVIPDESGWLLDEYDAERFWSHVNFHGGEPYVADALATAVGECWTWKNVPLEAYQNFQLYGRSVAAHRVAYRDFGGKIADDLGLDHLCRIHSCVNPKHLEPVTLAVNVARGLRGVDNLTHCRNGHEYTPENTKISARAGKPYRICRICQAKSKRATYRKRLAATS